MRAFDIFLDRFERHKFGIIGTLVLHTLVVFTMAMVQISEEPDEEARSEMRIEVLPDTELEDLVQPEFPADATERRLTNVVNNLNAERSEAARSAIDPGSRARIEEKVWEDLKNMEKEEFDRLMEEHKARGEEVDIPELDPSKWRKENYMTKPEKSAKVDGPTTVIYDLKDRHHYALPIPAYLCTDNGRVVVKVTVDRKGLVQRAQVDPGNSTQREGCLADFAVAYAQRARFNESDIAPADQIGTITFLFLPQ